MAANPFISKLGFLGLEGDLILASRTFPILLGNRGAVADPSLVMGRLNGALDASASRNVVIGINTAAVGAGVDDGVLVGSFGGITAAQAICIGGGENSTQAPAASGATAVAIGAINGATTGTGPRATSEGAIAIGGGSNLTGTATGPQATSRGAIAIGSGAEENDGAQASGAESIAIGPIQTRATSNYAIALGRQATASGQRSFAVGITSSATQTYAVGINGNATAESAIALGGASGGYAVASAVNAIAIGGNNAGNGASAAHAHGVAIGGGSATTKANQIVLGNATNHTEVLIPATTAASPAGAGALVVAGGIHGKNDLVVTNSPTIGGYSSPFSSVPRNIVCRSGIAISNDSGAALLVRGIKADGNGGATYGLYADVYTTGGDPSLTGIWGAIRSNQTTNTTKDCVAVYGSSEGGAQAPSSNMLFTNYGTTRSGRIGVQGNAVGPSTGTIQPVACGVRAEAVGNAQTLVAVGVYAKASGTTVNYAGYFVGDVMVNTNVNTTPPPAAPAGTVLQAIAANGSVTRIQSGAFGTGVYAAFAGRLARGTAAAPSAIQSGDEITHLSAWGYGATGYSSAYRAAISMHAAENWTDAAQGTRVSISTTAPAGIVTSEKVRVWGNGGVTINTVFGASPGESSLEVAQYTTVGSGLDNTADRALTVTCGTTVGTVLDLTASTAMVSRYNINTTSLASNEAALVGRAGANHGTGRRCRVTGVMGFAYFDGTNENYHHLTGGYFYSDSQGVRPQDAPMTGVLARVRSDNLRGNDSGTQNIEAIGVDAKVDIEDCSVSNSQRVYGVRGISTLAITTNGVAVTANYGGMFQATCNVTGVGSSTPVAYGVYASASGADTNWAGYFSGNVNITGKLTVGGLIDPTGLALTPVTTNPGGSLSASTFWVDADDSLPYFDNDRILTGDLLGVANGIATLDVTGKVPFTQLPPLAGGLSYQGVWAASTNTPTLADGDLVSSGTYYIASDSGSVDFGSGSIYFVAGDWVIYSGTVWQKIDNVNIVNPGTSAGEILQWNDSTNRWEVSSFVSVDESGTTLNVNGDVEVIGSLNTQTDINTFGSCGCGSVNFLTRSSSPGSTSLWVDDGDGDLHFDDVNISTGIWNEVSFAMTGGADIVDVVIAYAVVWHVSIRDGSNNGHAFTITAARTSNSTCDFTISAPTNILPYTVSVTYSTDTFTLTITATAGYNFVARRLILS